MHPANTAISRPTSVSRAVRRQRTRELFLSAHATDDPDERKALIDKVICLNVDVARTLAAPYGGRGIALEDLEQVACAALVRAAQGFRPDLSEDFLAYAVPTIRGEVKKHFRDHGWTVRPPRRIQELQAEVAHTRAALEQSTGHEPDLAEIAEELGEPESQIVEAMAADGCFWPTSLDQPLGTDSTTVIGDLVPAADDGYDAAEARAMLAPAVRRLRGRDRTIVRMRFFEGLTQKEIGDEIGVTQMQVSRLLTRILGELRTELADTREGRPEQWATPQMTA